LLKLHQSLFV